jgi:sarcosine oxidase subunit alpha
LLVDHGILAGDKVCLVEVPPTVDDAWMRIHNDNHALEDALRAAGAEVARVRLADVTGVHGRGWVSSLATAHGKLDCDVVAVAAIPAPASEGARQQGCRVVLDPGAGGFRIVVDGDGLTSTPNVWACGDVCGYLGPFAAAEHGTRVGTHVAGVS